MPKRYRYRSYKEREREAMAAAEREVLQKYGTTQNRTPAIEVQKAEYKKQQTLAGKKTISALEEMAAAMQQITNKPVKTGKLTPMYKYDTPGEIMYFYED